MHGYLKLWFSIWNALHTLVSWIARDVPWRARNLEFRAYLKLVVKWSVLNPCFSGR